MTLPFDATKSPPRTHSVTFFTDSEVAKRIKGLMRSSKLSRSDLVHRIVRQALIPAEEPPAVEEAPMVDPERRQGERRAS